MSRKRRKVRIDRILILLLLAMISICIIFFAVDKIIDLFSKNKDTEDTVAVNPETVDTSEDVKVSLVDYEIYTDDTESLGFDFIIAKLNFKSQKPVSFDLSNLQTSEKIYLNNVAKYINTLQEKGYKVSKLDFVNTVVSDQNDYTCNIFIPYTTKSSSLRLLNSLDATMINIDLTEHVNNITSLKFETEQQIEVGNTNVVVSSSSISTMMLHNGEEYQVPSTMNVYTFRISVNEVEDNIKIVDARFLRSSNDEVIQCLDETYESEKALNCLNKNLVLGDNGALFFETAIIGDSPDFEGFLMLKFSNSDDWIKISTTLD